eukprot:scaffold275130_cov36-Tisochrysis_lutea.AAC.1
MSEPHFGLSIRRADQSCAAERCAPEQEQPVKREVDLDRVDKGENRNIESKRGGRASDAQLARR